jgi:peptide deformylase
MAILKIARMGHPVLRRVAEPVADPSAPQVARLVADMLETMVDAEGVGLAAPQVHSPLRIVTFLVPRSRAGGGPDSVPGDADGPVPLTILINPEIEPLDDATEEGWEACLSVPGLTGLVPRHRRIRYRGVDPRGQAIERIAEGFHARVVQHECDHLDGILYPQRMADIGRLAFVDEIRRTVTRPRQPQPTQPPPAAGHTDAPTEAT